MQNKTELAVFSKLGEIFSDISFNSNGLEGAGISFSGTSAEFSKLAELLEVPTAIKSKEMPDTLTIADADWGEDSVTASLEEGKLWIITVDSGDENFVKISHKDAKSLAEFLNVKSAELLAENKEEQ